MSLGHTIFLKLLFVALMFATGFTFHLLWQIFPFFGFLGMCLVVWPMIMGAVSLAKQDLEETN